MQPISRRWSGLHLSLDFAGKQRDVEIGRWTAGAAVFLLSATVLWSLVTGFYVCFHDQLVGSLMSRQADMQYAYEDQIATLQTDLARATSRNLMDRRLLDTALQDLAARSGRLEARAATIDKLVAGGVAALSRDRTMGSASTSGAGDPDRSITVAPLPFDAGGIAPLSPTATDPAKLRLGIDDDHASLQPDALAARLAHVEEQQLNSVMQLRDPLGRASRRLVAALADTGLSGRIHVGTAQDVGGPFVPLPQSERGSERDSFEFEVAKTREALDHRVRLLAIIDRVPLRDPLEGPIEVSSSFGARVDPFLGRPALHTGIDLLETGSDVVRATAAGVVTMAGPNGGYGNMVEIDHGNGLVTRYAHLAAIDVAPRQKVVTGKTIGRVGSSGRATGPHLHYETRVDGEPVDPATFLIAGARLKSD